MKHAPMSVRSVVLRFLSASKAAASRSVCVVVVNEASNKKDPHKRAVCLNKSAVDR